MEALCAYTQLLMKRSRKRSYEAVLHRKREAGRRRKQFARRQTQQRLAFLLIMSVAALHIHSPIRSVWSKERSSFWWEQIVGRTFTPQDWLENFRMSRATFLYLCNELRSAITKDDTTMRKAIPSERRVALTLWFLATNADYRTIGHLFGVSKSTVCVVTKDVCAAIVRKLLPKYIRIPTADGLKDVVEGFKHKWEFPQCAGAVDGTHIPIISPEECPADYFNRKGWHSILMQGVVTTWVTLQMFTLGGLVAYMMLGFLRIPHSTRKGKMVLFFLIGRNQLLVQRSHSCFWETLRTLFYRGL